MLRWWRNNTKETRKQVYIRRSLACDGILKSSSKDFVAFEFGIFDWVYDQAPPCWVKWFKYVVCRPNLKPCFLFVNRPLNCPQEVSMVGQLGYILHGDPSLFFWVHTLVKNTSLSYIYIYINQYDFARWYTTRSEPNPFSQPNVPLAPHHKLLSSSCTSHVLH